MTTRADDTPALIAAAGPEAVAAWQEFVPAGRLAPSTRAVYAGLARRFLEWLEARGGGLTRVTPDLVQEFLDAGRADAATKQLYRRLLSRFFAALVTHGVVSENPAELLRTLWQARPPTAPLAGVVETLADQFARFSPVERQATVDAAAVALALHEIHSFTGGAGGQAADVERCDEALRLGERYGVMPLAGAPSPDGLAEPGGVGADDPGVEAGTAADEP